jgi:hypothetical protein
MRNQKTTGPTRATTATVHAEMMRERKGRSLDSTLAAFGDGGFFRPRRIQCHHGYYFLDFQNPGGHVCMRTGITVNEAADPRLEGLMLS